MKENNKLKYPRDAKGICTGCGASIGYHKKDCPANKGREENKK